MTNLENEIFLLKEWLSGNHREDIAHFDADVFHYKTLFEDIREGLTLQKLGANITAGKYQGIESINDVLGAIGSGAFYYGALGDGLTEQRSLYVKQLDRHPEEQAYWIDKITAITNIINSKEDTSRSANFSDLFFTELEARQNESNPHYGIKKLDEITEGLHRGQLVILGARPGVGKSIFGLQVARNVIKEGYKCLYLPLEMTEYETLQRLIVQEQIVFDMNEAKQPSEQQRAEIKNYLDEIEQSGLFNIYYALNKLESIEKKTKEEEPFLVVVDQLTQVEPIGKAKDIRDKYMQITASLKRLALQENVCILALHQLNRASTERKRPSLEHLAESDSVGRDADIVLLLNADENEDYQDLRYEELHIVKHRQGKAGDIVPLQLYGARSSFFRAELRTKEETTERF